MGDAATMSDELELLELSGCLYERPTRDGEERDWRVDPVTGASFPFDLTVSEISSMKFDEVPIKIEHAHDGFSSNDEVGRVREVVTDPKTGYTAVKFALHNTIAGRTVARLVNGGTLNSLSLGHTYDPATKSVSPSEVSVCFNGAREGSCLYKEVSEYARFKSKVQDIMATITQANPDTNPTTAHDGDGTAPVVDQFAGQTAPPEAPDLVSLLESCTQGGDEEKSTELFRQVAGIVAERNKTMEESEKQKQEIATLQDQVTQQEAATTRISQDNKQDAAKIVATMNALLAEFAPGSGGITDTDGCSAAHNHAQVALQVPVLASALNAYRAQTTTYQNSMSSLRDHLANDIRERLMTPYKRDVPQTMVPNNTDVPHIAVNASARHIANPQEPPAKRSRWSGLTEGQRSALSGFGKYGDGTAPRLTADMLPTNFNGLKN